jgi:uncharacterized protein (DUF2147 family)
MKQLFVSAVLAVPLMLSGISAKAQTIKPAQQAVVGNYSDGVGGIVEFRIEGGKLYGKIVHNGGNSDKSGLCKKCDGDLKNKPLLGMDTFWGFTPDSTDDKWGGGKTVDIRTGFVYQGKIWTEDGGKTLNLRGYIGNPVLGQTMVWKRAN